MSSRCMILIGFKEERLDAGTNFMDKNTGLGWDGTYKKFRMIYKRTWERSI